jgi:hypothetical protein
MMKLGWAIVAALALWGIAGTASAQSQYVRGTLDRIDAVADDSAYSSSLVFDVSRVTAGQYRYQPFVPTGNGPVRVSTACDTDCNRIQLRVADFQNQDVAYEQYFTGASTLLFYPQPGQTYWVYAQPMDCSTTTCYVIISVQQ